MPSTEKYWSQLKLDAYIVSFSFFLFCLSNRYIDNKVQNIVAPSAPPGVLEDIR